MTKEKIMPKTTKKLLGARIKELRKLCGISQEELAAGIGVDPKHVSRLEVGGSFPALDTLEKISQVLHVELKVFFEFQHLQADEEINKDLDLLFERARQRNKTQLLRIVKALVE
jgi:transcriptional regulator with XRE-family HTH domain